MIVIDKYPKRLEVSNPGTLRITPDFQHFSQFFAHRRFMRFGTQTSDLHGFRQ